MGPKTASSKNQNGGGAKPDAVAGGKPAAKKPADVKPVPLKSSVNESIFEEGTEEAPEKLLRTKSFKRVKKSVVDNNVEFDIDAPKNEKDREHILKFAKQCAPANLDQFYTFVWICKNVRKGEGSG